MCEPTTLATIGTVMSIGGTVFSAYNQYQTGKAQNNMAKVQARMSEDQARDAIDRGAVAEAEHRRKVSQFKGQQRSVLAASGVELDSGSASDLQADTAMLGELDALTIRNNAEREAYGYRSNAASSRFEGAQAQRAGTMSAGGTLLGGLGGELVSSKWYDSKSALTTSTLGSTWSEPYGPPRSLMNS